MATHPSQPRPVILAVDADADAIERIGDELHRRYGQDYRIVTAHSAPAGLSQLERMRDAGDRLAIVLAEQWMPEITGGDLLAQASEMHPHAKRGLLISWADWANYATTTAVRKAMAFGHIDYYVLKPWKSPDELFHRTIAEFLHEWAGADPLAPREITVVAEALSERGHQLRSLLTKNRVPHVFHASDSPEGSRILLQADRERSTEPVVRLLNGRVLIDPSNAELASGYGMLTELHGPRQFDVVVVGAGPAGLSAAVYSSSEGLKTLVVEREAIGGQAGASSRIRNYLGFSRGISGAELAQRAYQQAWVFGTTFLVMTEVKTLRADGARCVVTLADGTEIYTGSVILAMGVDYRQLQIPALDRLHGRGVFYGSSSADAQQFDQAQVFVVGGGNSAGQAAVHLSRYAAKVTILVRGTDLAASMSQYLLDEIHAMPNIDVRLQTQVVDGAGESRLEQLTLKNRSTAETETVPADGLFVLIGACPFTGWLPKEVVRDAYDFVVTGAESDDWTLERPPFSYETTMPGVFAVGDVRSGSVKRVASAVGEGSVVIQQVHEHLHAEEHAHR